MIISAATSRKVYRKTTGVLFMETRTKNLSMETSRHFPWILTQLHVRHCCCFSSGSGLLGYDLFCYLSRWELEALWRRGNRLQQLPIVTSSSFSAPLLLASSLGALTIFLHRLGGHSCFLIKSCSYILWREILLSYLLLCWPRPSHGSSL
jgi:hypothetical protein